MESCASTPPPTLSECPSGTGQRILHNFVCSAEYYDNFPTEVKSRALCLLSPNPTIYNSTPQKEGASIRSAANCAVPRGRRGYFILLLLLLVSEVLPFSWRLRERRDEFGLAEGRHFCTVQIRMKNLAWVNSWLYLVGVTCARS